MCGIAGIVGSEPCDSEQLSRRVTGMTGALAHRGPDGDGFWLDGEAGVGFGHRRLAIIDLSPMGRQPMVSANGRFVLTYNGEIYNYGELADDLNAKGVIFHGRSDSEVLLEACANLGVETVLPRLNGIFAFALFDRKTRRTWLARDQMGIKPLYWAVRNGQLLFASELKALVTSGLIEPVIDRAALAAYLRLCTVPAPFSIFKDVNKLEAGCFLSLRPGEAHQITTYFDAKQVALEARDDPLTNDEIGNAAQLEELLTDAVRGQMMSDVPLGAFLSGGIDSSMVLALMQAQSSRPIKTFTIGFNEADFDEAERARRVAAHLGTDHTELYLTSSQALDIIERMPEIYDEPFADSSMVPTTLLAGLTRDHVTVALSGDGGDELFAGYQRYTMGDAIWRGVGKLPAPVRSAFAAAATAVPVPVWDQLFRTLPENQRVSHAGDRMHKLARIIDARDGSEMYHRLRSVWPEPDQLVRHGGELQTALDDPNLSLQFSGLVERMMLLDTLTYLPDDILVKVDRASMSFGLEVRVPLLDPRVFAFAWRLPMNQKLHGGQGKRLLRRVLEQYVPADLMTGPKRGFGVPIDSWLRGPLKEWGAALLDPQRLAERGFLNPDFVKARWDEHQSGRRNWQDSLWAVLMFEAWYDRWMADASAAARGLSA